MKPPFDEPLEERDETELVAHLYGDADDPEAVETALARSPELRSRYDELRRTLELMDEPAIPDCRDDYGAEVWRRIERRLERETGQLLAFPPALAGRRMPVWIGLAAAAVLLLVAGFLLGRLGAPTPDAELARAEESTPALSSKARQRLLQAALAEHLGHSERLLTEVANASTPRFDLSGAEMERLWAAELLASNRLYRRAAEQAGQKRIARLLVELEPVLLELSHAAASDDDERGQLRRRVDEQGLLFKVRVTERRLEPAHPVTTLDSL